jgi:hypothetical protein
MLGREWSFWTIVFLSLFTERAQSKISLNIKSSQLSSLLSGERNEKSDIQGISSIHSPEAESSSKKSSRIINTLRDTSSLVRLDLSGRLNIDLLGPVLQYQSPPETLPLIRVPVEFSESASKPSRTMCSAIPNVQVGIDYDFGQKWWGFTGFRTAARWTRFRSMSRDPTGSDESSSLERKGLLSTVLGYRISRLVPISLEIGNEYSTTACRYDAFTHADHEFGANGAGRVTVQWPPLVEASASETARGANMLCPSLTGKILTNGSSGLSALLPLHRRFRLHWNLSNAKTRLTQKPTVSPEGKFDWVIPDVSINALGLLESRNEAWVKTKRIPFLEGAPSAGGSVGFRLYIRRQLQWNALSIGVSPSADSARFDESSYSTLLRLDVKAIDTFRSGMSTTARLETILERPIDSTSISLIQETNVGS